MRERFCYLLIISLLSYIGGNAQKPIIQKVESQISFPNSNILISGSGFSSNAAQLDVWFDQVKGTIISSTEFSIEVKVPPQARLDNITVINKNSFLSAQSPLKYMLAYSGEGFDPNQTQSTVYDYTNTGSSVFSLATGDIDLDGKPDFVGSRRQFETPLSATNLVLRMNQSTIGNINFVEKVLAPLNLNAPTSFLALKDLNGDGKPELFASRGGASSNSIYILENTSTIGNPAFATNPVIRSMDVGQIAQEIGVADLNGDGKPEIVVANSASNEIYVYINESANGVLNINSTPVKILTPIKTSALELQDIDSDGKTDIVITQPQGSDIYILKNTTAPLASEFNFTTTKISQAGLIVDLITADFNKDGKLDIVVSSLVSITQPTTAGEATVLINNSTTSAIKFDNRISNLTGLLAFGLDVCDLNGDGFPDFIASNQSKSIDFFLHKRTSLGFDKISLTTSQNNWYIKAGDLDGDAKPDLVYTSFINRNTGPFNIEILRNKNCHKPAILNPTPLTICASQIIQLKTIPIPGHTFDWSNGFTVTNTAVPTFNATVAATYTVKAIGPDGCSVTSAPVTIESGAGSLPADPVITTNAPICAGTALTLSTPVVTGATYAWTGPDNFTSNVAAISIPAATVANAGIYSLTLKSGVCSSNTITKRVDIVTFGSFSISSSNAGNVICQSQSLTLTVNSATGYSYQWLKDNIILSGKTAPSLIVTEGGSYKVKVSNTALGCSQETSPVAVVVYSAPVASFTLDASGCIGTLINFSNISITDTNVTSVTNLWEFGDNTTSTDEDPTHTYSTAQTFSPKLTVGYSGVSGCTSSVTKSITIATATPPVITTLNAELCNNGAEKSRLSVSGNFTSYKWSTGEETPNIDVTSPGDYKVDTVEPNGCKGFDTFTITEKTDCNTQIPLVFTPNGDSQNDLWILPGIENKQDCTMNIFDGRGRKVLEKKGFPVGGWDGVSEEGKTVPDGTYYYVFSCPDQTAETGSVLIVR